MLSVSRALMRPSFRMFLSGLLVLTNPTSHILSAVPQVLSQATEHVRDVLYVHLAPGLDKCSSGTTPQLTNVPCTSSVSNLITQFYSHAANKHELLDLRIVIGNIGTAVPHARPSIEKYHFINNFDVLLTDCPESAFRETLTSYAERYFTAFSNGLELRNISVECQLSGVGDTSLVERYDNICMGGTFDRLHTGHKILLSRAAMLTKERLIVGVTDGNMTDTKTLPELIESTELRIKATQDFLEDVKPQITYEVVPITDPYGPSTSDPNIQCIVVSQETVRGGAAINRKRLERGMSELVVDVIDLLDDAHHLHGEENKISSSSLRKRLLGTLLRQPDPKSCSEPYIIGLTGGIASGKSSVCKRLEKLGAAIVDCDKLGHQSYSKDGAAYTKMIDTFGADIVDEEGNINRKLLGPKIFGNDIAREALNNIVWPVIQDLARAQISQYHKEGHSIVFMDAAILLEAEWDTMTNEVWTTVIPRDEAVKRIVQRNNLSEEAALERITSQMSNEERVSRAHVVLCTLWEYDITQKQVEKAWALLQQRLKKSTSRI